MKILKSEKLWLWLIFLLGLGLRFYRLGQVPSGFVNDEADFGYNAYSLIKTGKDEFGHPWPLIFQSFGDGKMPAYFYLTIPSVLIFGLTELAVRLPSALFGSLTIILVYLIAKQLLPKSKLFPLLSSLVLATFPWHIHFSRAAFEANLGLFFITLGTYLWLKQKVFLSGLSFTASLLSYHAPRIFVPLWLLFLLWRSQGKHKLILFVALPWCLLTFSKSSLLRAGGITIFHEQSGVIQRLTQKYAETRNQPLVLTRALHNRPVEYFLDFSRRYFSHFDSDFLFFSGDPNRPRYRTPDMGQALWLTLPFFYLGLYVAIRRQLWLLLVWLGLAPLAGAITFETPSAIRSLIMAVPLSLITGLGLSWSIKYLGKLKYLLLILFIYNLVYYLDAYFVHLPVHQPYEWQGGYKQLVAKVTQLMPQYDKAVIADVRGTPYIYFLFYNRYDPTKWQEANKAITVDPKFKYYSFGQLDNLYFVGKTCPANSQQWPADAVVPEPRTLYVCTEEHHPLSLLKDGTLEIIETINFDDGQPAFVLMARPQ